MSSDPETPKIKTICESLIGCKINIGFTITLESGEKRSGELENCNIVGDCMENILYPFIKNYIPTFEEGPKQASPDFYNSKIWASSCTGGQEIPIHVLRDFLHKGDTDAVRRWFDAAPARDINQIWEWELKCFQDTPNFDISNFNSYISQLEGDLEKKMYRTQYLIFKYNLEDRIITITDFKLCNVWEIMNYGGKYPIPLQVKKGNWCNIRPCCFNDMNASYKTPTMFINQIVKAINQCPDEPYNTQENKTRTINKIIQQFNELHPQIVL
tara:strand:+ start:17968 stop:18777 length:810 start_codon:yes stop_codon:yes gene_type:complete